MLDVLVCTILAALKPKVRLVAENLCLRITGAAAQAPADESAQCGPAVLDLRQSMVR